MAARPLMSPSDLRIVRILALAGAPFAGLASFGLLYDFAIGWWVLAVAVPWLVLLVVNRGRTRAGWVGLVLPLGLGPACLVDVGLDNGEGGSAAHFAIAFGWWALGTMLVAMPRPGLVARGAIVSVAWIVAAFALFWF